MAVGHGYEAVHVTEPTKSDKLRTFLRLPATPNRTAAFTKGEPPQSQPPHFQTLLDSHYSMDGQTKMSSPTFSSNLSDGNVAPRSAHFTPIRPDHVGSQDPTPAADGYDSNRSPSGSATMGDSGGSKRRKVNHVHAACLYCRRSHMTCDSNRPCARCVKRNIGHLCHDEVKDKSRENGSESTSQSPAVDATSPDQLVEGEIKTDGAAANQPGQTHRSPPPLQPSSNDSFDFLNLSWQSYPYLQAPYTFASDVIGNEFSVLNDFMTLGDDLPNFDNTLNDPMGGIIGENNFNPDPNFNQLNPPNGNNLLPQGQDSMMFNAPQRLPTPNPNGGNRETDVAKEHYLLTAADPAGEVSPEERLKQVINAKVDAGILKPFNYVKGYARLQKYMEIHMSPMARQRILRTLGVFRPTFRAISQNLKDVDLVLVEEFFERLLLDYDRVFTSMAIPACLWRRTGEIYRGNKEFAALINVALDELRDGRLAIYELMAEESVINYWEKYGNIAFDNGQKAVLTSCLLKNPDTANSPNSQSGRAGVINCCFSFTIRRDRYNIPSCIVGNFIPIDMSE